MNSKPHISSATIALITSVLSLISLFICTFSFAATPKDQVHALYIPAHKITQRTLDEIVHYASLTPINAVVLHVKTPKGKLLWPSKNAIAVELGVGTNSGRLARHVARLKKDNIYTIAKVDVFADHQLAMRMPELSIMNRLLDSPWTDANGLHWSNPSDSRVWNYNIELSRELARMGFDEIQFDYIRFPSDGDLSVIHYPNAAPGFSKSDCIQSFLERAQKELKPLNVNISADIFGLTAWKSDDFGVGQVLEKMAPYLDVVCPMFYPSHFPTGFLGKSAPGQFPEMIMEASMKSMMKRTNKPVRPWIQGFWYQSGQIAVQIDGIEKAAGRCWSIWNPTGRYGLSYKAIADRMGITLSKPQYYLSLEELEEKTDRLTRGHSAVVNYTSFQKGFTILSLEAPKRGEHARYSTPIAVLTTMEEGIMDYILEKREIPFNPNTEPGSKRKILSDLLCSDIGKDARRLRPGPIYIDWAQTCKFVSQGIPEARMTLYTKAAREGVDEALASVSTSKPINIASISESVYDVVTDTDGKPIVAVISQ